jgi:hypothetical protein
MPFFWRLLHVSKSSLHIRWAKKIRSRLTYAERNCCKNRNVAGRGPSLVPIPSNNSLI